MFDDILQKIEAAIAVLVGLIRAGHPLCGTASGKDSTCATILMLEAVRRTAAENTPQPAHFVSSANTTIENVSLSRHIETMLEEIDDHAALYGLGVTTHIATPSLAMQFVVSTIGRGTLVRTPENGVRNGKRIRACATYGDPSRVNSAVDTLIDRDLKASPFANHAETLTTLFKRPLSGTILLTLGWTKPRSHCGYPYSRLICHCAAQ
jgi:hypothetical protein